MPCEGCNIQFTVFKRKRICSECRRFYCNQCLTKHYSSLLCERCLIFTKRPLLKVDLLKLKPKDLIFYLQSKHISTTGCVEKEELVNLVLTHVNDSNTANRNQSFDTTSSNASDTATNPFDNIKQSCQSFFNNFSDKIDFNFDSKSNKSSPDSETASQNISDQPRKREIPTYSRSSTNAPPTPTIILPNDENIGQSQRPPPPPSTQPPSTPSSSTSSPVASLSSISSQSVTSSRSQKRLQQNLRSPSDQSSSLLNKKRNENIPSVHKQHTSSCASKKRLFDNVLQNNNTDSASGCECSDDEVIATFKTQKARSPQDKLSPVSPGDDSAFDEQLAGPSGASTSAESANGSKSSSDLKQPNAEESSGSSFEELGAVGGCGGGSVAAEAEKWQFVEKIPVADEKKIEKHSENLSNSTMTVPSATTTTTTTTVALVPTVPELERYDFLSSLRLRRVSRRRSDGFIYNRQLSEGAIGHTAIAGPDFTRVDEESESDELSAAEQQSLRKRVRKSCSKCGKKNNIKRHVAKFKRHLESSQMSETDIKKELEEFLAYLENRAKSFDCSDSEMNLEMAGSSGAGGNGVDHTGSGGFLSGIEFDCNFRAPSDEDDIDYFGDNDGIHVYAHNDESGMANSRFDSRFMNLGDFRSSNEFEDLTVKQLKEILMLNRVDYKGCCEKQELLERVNRLWKNFQSCPAVEKLPTDELCKICMDAPIECVILECGHMATCTNCGKVLSECPICRQYIVRVVRFFRA